ncbi:MAG: ammonium transporter [Ilumatobacteraceae bacterium]|jgi:Amt family ammonium transporter|nr:ammonium transporter [Ilumatobacteraceae bacterium]MBJ7427244.1 ammonium transporter [Ilumatobacteraceae bacterium]
MNYTIDSGAVAWVLVSTALVLFMTPGLAFFYGGMVRSKNVLGMLLQNIFAMGLVTVLWVAVGFSLAFGGTNGWIGNFDFAFLKDITTVGELPGYTGAFALAIPPILFMGYQMMFAIITPALITGATADRLKFSAYAVLIGVWAVLVYPTVAHWVFSPNGWLFKEGALDFAGGAVVHINAGAAALAVILILKPRKGWPREAMPPHNLPFTVLGTGILWFGWFGFNAGSALAANGLAAQALVNTHVAAAAAMLGWLLIEKLKAGHATTLGAVSGAVAGLVAITPCAGFVSTSSALLIGLAAGAICYLSLALKNRFGFDDSLDVIAVHLIGGLLGSLLLGLFSDTTINSLGADGLFNGGGSSLLGKQLLASVAVFAFSFGVTYIVAIIINKTMGLRVTHDEEMVGLDQSQHAETAYQV